MNEMRRLINLIESAEAQALEEGLFSKAAILGSLMALLSSAGVQSDRNAVDQASAEVFGAMKQHYDLNDPRNIAISGGEILESGLGIPRDQIIPAGPEKTKIASVIQGFTNTSTDTAKRQMESGDWQIQVIRSSTETRDPGVWETTCSISGLYTDPKTGNMITPRSIFVFYHKDLGQWADLKFCNPRVLAQHLTEQHKKGISATISGDE